MLDDAFDLESGMMTFRMIWSLLKETLCLNGHRHHHHHHRHHHHHHHHHHRNSGIVIVMLMVQHTHVDSRTTLSTFNQ